MAQLHNRINQEVLKELLYKESFKRVTISFYSYFKIDNPQQFRDNLYIHLNKLSVFGRIYVAHEGINAQISVPEFNYDLFKQYLYSIEPLNNLRLNIAIDDDGKSFWVLKIKVRDKIVADGITDEKFNMDKRGQYVTAEEFNKLTNDKNTIVIDMRNHYEYEVGHFKGAIEVPSDTFREQLPMSVEMMKENKDKNIIMYCTGGIRCEKASAYMKHHGFKNVYHLEGGIINYINQVREKKLENRFIGKNFVFDQRLGERVTDDIIAKCHQCGKPADTHVNCANTACHLLFIQCEECSIKMKNTCSQECLEIINLPIEKQKELRKGIDKGRMVFNKSKQRRLM